MSKVYQVAGNLVDAAKHLAWFIRDSFEDFHYDYKSPPKPIILPTLGLVWLSGALLAFVPQIARQIPDAVAQEAILARFMGIVLVVFIIYVSVVILGFAQVFKINQRRSRVYAIAGAITLLCLSLAVLILLIRSFYAMSMNTLTEANLEPWVIAGLVPSIVVYYVILGWEIVEAIIERVNFNLFRNAVRTSE